MKMPDWQSLIHHDGVLIEPTPDRGRLVLWVKRDRVNGYQEWDRISTAIGTGVGTEHGVYSIAATYFRTRQKLSGLAGLIRRIWTASTLPTWVLPNGAISEQCGQRNNDLILAWSDNNDLCLDQDRIKARWPECTGMQSLGRNLFAVYGVTCAEVVGNPVALWSQESPLQIAERLLEAAREQADRASLVSALTDLGIVVSQEGNCQRAIDLLEEALALSRQMGDRSREVDVLGNLGLALAAKNPQRAHELLLQELALARPDDDPFARKTALNHLGLFYLRARSASKAKTHLEEGLAIAKSIGDRQHEAELTWLLGIVHVELGLRDQGITLARQSIRLFEALGKPQANVLADHLRRFQANDSVVLAVSPLANVAGESAGAKESSQLPSAGGTAPGLLRMGFSAAKAMGRFIGSGMKRVSPETYEERQRACASCEHHTGLRCKLCGCFTVVKAWLPKEECPIRKWPIV